MAPEVGGGGVVVGLKWKKTPKVSTKKAMKGHVFGTTSSCLSSLVNHFLTSMLFPRTS